MKTLFTYLLLLVMSASGFKAQKSLKTLAPPINNNCANAIALTVNPDTNCTIFKTGTTIDAYQSSEIEPTCGVALNKLDVWFKFTATRKIQTIKLLNIIGNPDMVMAAYIGACGNLTQIKCSDPETMTLTKLVIGSEYKIRVWTNSDTDTRSTFDICVTSGPIPVNDDCAGAISLNVSNSEFCTAPQSGTTINATNTSGGPNCNGAGVDDDVWYSFIATSTTHLVTVDYEDFHTSMQIYSGSCTNEMIGACVNGNYGNSNILWKTFTVGQKYYLRIFSTNPNNTFSNFKVCITTPSVPTNDNCATPQTIPCDGMVSGSNALATNDIIPTSSCGFANPIASSRGVWFKVTATKNGPMTISACGTDYDSFLRVYTGDCATLSCTSNVNGVGYADAGCPGLNNSPIVTFNATMGTTYRILLTAYSDTQFGNYIISANCSALATSNVIATDEIKVYPNPFTDVLNISDVKDLATISVRDLSGRLVRSLKASSTLNLVDLKSGIYLVSLTYQDGSVKTVKAIKK